MAFALEEGWEIEAGGDVLDGGDEVVGGHCFEGHAEMGGAGGEEGCQGVFMGVGHFGGAVGVICGVNAGMVVVDFEFDGVRWKMGSRKGG